MKISRNWLQIYFTEPLPSIHEIDDALVMHSFETEGIEQVGDDDIIEIDILPNRAPDSLCHRGIARELASILRRSDYTEPSHTDEAYNGLENISRLSSRIENVEQCHAYYMGRIDNISVQESPAWLKNRLESVGQKSINALVDITNYVMLDIGTPVHIFDADKITGEHIIVRNAKEGEVFTPLGSDKEYSLDERMLVIADEKKVLALAGVKGGTAAEVDQNTKNIIIEVAHFDAQSTRKTRVKTGLMTDSSKRFENSFTVQHCKEALSYLYTHILQSEIAGTSTSHAFAPLFNNSDTYKEEIHSIHVSHNHITRVLGTAITQDEIQKILLGLRMGVSAENGIYTVEPPSDRMDIAIQEDVIEEVGRMYGYHNIPSRSLDDIEYQPQVHPETALEMTLRNICIEHGFSEVMTYSFEKKGDTYVHNPVAKDKPALRKNLTNGMTKSLEKNVYYADLLGLDSVRIFQWGSAFTKDGEKIHCALGVAHVDKKARKKYGQPHEILNTLISEINSTCGLTIPHATEKDNGIIEIDITQIIHEKNPLLPTTYTQIINTLSETTFSSLSPYPHSVRDISVWVPEHISANTVSESIDESTSEIMVRMDLFDTFTKDEKTSYAFRMVFQSMEKTLTDTEVDNEMKSIEQAFSKKGWEIR